MFAAIKIAVLAVLSASGKAILAIIMKLATEKFLIEVFIKLGEYLVKSTTNDLDDKLLEEAKKALKIE